MAISSNCTGLFELIIITFVFWDKKEWTKTHSTS